MLDPSSPRGYEIKHATLRVAGRYRDAREVLETMLSKVSESSNPDMRGERNNVALAFLYSPWVVERFCRYVSPAQTEEVIRGVIQDVIGESPLVLINTNSGRLLDKPGQASSFESQPIFHELVSSMTTDIDRARIKDEVAHYYRYAMFSHKWGGNEPLYEEVMHVVVLSSRNLSLMTSCKCSAKSCGTPGWIGLGLILVASIEQILLCYKRPWSPCSSGTRGHP